MNTQTLAEEAECQEQNQLLFDKRQGRRQTYICRHLVAPFDGVRMPRQDEFEWAMFKDVSATGISFLAEIKPVTKQLIVAVGPAPFTFLIVEVVRISEQDNQENQFYHIGCRILRELND